MHDILTIHTLGAFSVKIGDVVISDESMRSQKIWKLFKYFMTNRYKMISIETLIEVIWPDNEPQNPLKSLHTLMSRLRKALNRNNESEQYILFSHNCYQWNPEIAIDLDVANFEKLIQKAQELTDNTEKQHLLEEAVKLYVGNYMSESATEIWVLPVMNYYRQMYLQAVFDLMNMYIQSFEYDAIVKLCNVAIQIEPYEEKIYEELIKALIAKDEIIQAKKQYQHIADLIQKQFGARPSSGLQALLEEIKEAENDYAADPDTIKKKLEAKDIKRGALYCSNEMFKQIYQMDKRSEERLQFPVFLGVVTAVFRQEIKQDPILLRNATQVLRQSIVKTLRNGDVISRYSKTQYMILLSAYHLKDAEAAMRRIQRLFMNESASVGFDLKIDLSQISDKIEIAKNAMVHQK